MYVILFWLQFPPINNISLRSEDRSASKTNLILVNLLISIIIYVTKFRQVYQNIHMVQVKRQLTRVKLLLSGCSHIMR